MKGQIFVITVVTIFAALFMATGSANAVSAQTDLNQIIPAGQIADDTASIFQKLSDLMHGKNIAQPKPYAGSDEEIGAKASVRKIEASIAQDRDKIIAESKAIKDDERKLQTAKKAGDKAAIDQLTQDIGTRRASIKEIKKGIAAKKESRSGLLYGKFYTPRRGQQETQY